MMRSWGSRSDTYVCDEPFYAHYLTRIDARRHPGCRETLAAHETDWRKVVAWLSGPTAPDKVVFYQKQMAHHMLPEIALGWIDGMTNCFLIRQPRDMLASLIEFLPEPTLADTGLPQQVQLFRQVAASRQAPPPVLDAHDVLDDPPRILGLLCEAVGVPFDAAMLRWPPGPRDSDGAWGPFWYSKVYETTAFAPYHGRKAELPARLDALLAECEPLYAELFKSRLR
jgi:hypothetical protein